MSLKISCNWSHWFQQAPPPPNQRLPPPPDAAISLHSRHFHASKPLHLLFLWQEHPPPGLHRELSFLSLEPGHVHCSAYTLLKEPSSPHTTSTRLGLSYFHSQSPLGINLNLCGFIECRCPPSRLEASWEERPLFLCSCTWNSAWYVAGAQKLFSEWMKYTVSRPTWCLG